MESRFGHDFSRVRVHTDELAAQSAEALAANAYTVGRDVVFAFGRYGPGTGSGQRLLAHELTHVIQQNGTPLSNAGVVQRQGRGDRDREDARGRRTEGAQDDDQRRERPLGGRSRRDRRSDPFSDFESDRAGRAILERYLGGEGDWDIDDDTHWTEYMKGSERLRSQLRRQVIREARRVATQPGDKGLPLRIFHHFHAELENGEGIAGYQYLHGTNEDVGDFLVAGSATVKHVFGESVPGVEESVQTGVSVNMQLHFVWNDVIDPNSEYTTDKIKSAIAEIITFGEADSYTISIGWHDQPGVWLPDEGDPTIYGYPGG